MEGRDNIRNHGMNEREDYVSIDIQEDSNIPLFDSMREMIDGLPRLSDDCSIFRVPKRMRGINENAYTPQVVSIGPFHRDKKHLQAMEEHKPRYLQSFLNRTNKSLKDCIKVAKGWEEKARSYYAERIELSSDEFVKMIILDSSFIIENILRGRLLMLEEEMNYLYRQIMVNHAYEDMILIENQIPYFVIEGLYNLCIPPSKRNPSFLKHCIMYLARFCFVCDINQSFSSGEVKHFVDLLRLCHLPSSRRSQCPGNVKYVPIRNATKLHEAGIKFKKSLSNRLLDITHNSRKVTLEIPKLTISNWTESSFLNLLALEQFHYLSDSYIIDYVHFMDHLIDTAKDVDLLIGNGIVDNYLGDSYAVASLFNKLSQDVILWTNNYYFYDINDELNKYCKDPWHKWKATLRHDYFSTPWRTASTVAAVILLGLTLIQTICSIVSL